MYKFAKLSDISVPQVLCVNKRILILFLLLPFMTTDLVKIRRTQFICRTLSASIRQLSLLELA